MDLNDLYSRHQISMMRARATASRLDRTKHLAAAGLFAHRIHNYQLAKGAGAAAGWLEDTRRGHQGSVMPSDCTPLPGACA
jgi:hypothetical protein